MGHFGGIIISDCKIGDHCSVNHQTIIGILTHSRCEHSGVTIGSNVWIGAHVRIFDAIEVGDRSTISAGSVVDSNVREDALVMGNPAVSHFHDVPDLKGYPVVIRRNKYCRLDVAFRQKILFFQL